MLDEKFCDRAVLDTPPGGHLSPFMVLVSPTKRCGKTTVLILLYYLTPRAEWRATFGERHLSLHRRGPADAADRRGRQFVKDNEEMRGGSRGRYSPRTRTTAGSRNSRSGSGAASKSRVLQHGHIARPRLDCCRSLKLTVVRILCCRRRRLNHRTDSGQPR